MNLHAYLNLWTATIALQLRKLNRLACSVKSTSPLCYNFINDGHAFTNMITLSKSSNENRNTSTFTTTTVFFRDAKGQICGCQTKSHVGCGTIYLSAIYQFLPCSLHYWHTPVVYAGPQAQLSANRYTGFSYLVF